MMPSSAAYVSVRFLFVKTKIGSPYVVAALDELRAAGGQRIVGWEANGGFLTGSDIALDNSALAALPTRDSTLPILANLFAAASQGISLSIRGTACPHVSEGPD
jgi:phosphomannomutase